MARKDGGGSRAGWHASMSVALGLGLGFFVLTSVAGVLGVGLVVGYQNTVDLLQRKAALIVGAQRDRTHRLLQAAENQVDFVAVQIADGEVEPGSDREFISLLLGAVSATPQILRLQFIDNHGRLSGVERRDDEAVAIFLRVGDDSDLQRLVELTAQNGRPYWGPLLWREEYGQAVVNYQRPALRGGVVVGMLSAWISTQQLSEFLSELESTQGANAFILHGPDEVLAHPLLSFGHAGLTRAMPLPRRAGFADPVIAAMGGPARSSIFANWFLSGPGVEHVGYGAQEYVILFEEVRGYSDRPWLIGTYFPSHDLAAEAARLRWAIAFCIAMAAVSAGAAAWLGRRIAQPVRRLADAAKQVHSMELASVDRIPRSFFRELDDAARSFNAMLDGLRWFERYVPKALVRRLMTLNPAGEIETAHREVAVMFTDIAGFTTISEGLTAPATARFLNDLLGIVAGCVDAEGGTVDKFIGDSVLAVWGAPDWQPDGADRACRCALAIARAVRRYDASRVAGRREVPRLQLRIGLHFGRVVAGNIGTAGRVNYTVVGDAVNVAQRLEEAAKSVGDHAADANILVSDSVRRRLVGTYVLSPLGSQPLRGRREQVAVFVLRENEVSSA